MRKIPALRTISGRISSPSLIERCGVYAHRFVDENKKEAQYWLDVGTIKAYYEANMDLVAVSPQFNLYDKEWPIRTYQRQYPPAKFVFGRQGSRMGVAIDSIVSAGSIISGGKVISSVLGPDVRIHSYCEVDQSILFAHVDIGRYCRIRNAIIDRGIVIPENTTIGYDSDQDMARYHISDGGIVVVAEDTGIER